MHILLKKLSLILKFKDECLLQIIYSNCISPVDGYYAPFIATSDIDKVSNVLLKDLLPDHNLSSVKLVPQLLSNNGYHFRLFASAIVDLGYNEINWNIGCPFPMVTNKKKGSGILPYPDLIRNVLDIVCRDNSYLLTVKMRLGLDKTEEGMRVVECLNEYPLAGVIIHARTGIQMYTGSVDLNSFKTLASVCKHQVTYNGDIYTYADYLNISQSLPAIKNFMLGRGALSDPFLPSTIKAHIIPYDDKVSKIKDFHDEIFTNYKNVLSGDKHVLDKMKEFWTYLSVHMDKDGKFMKKIKKCHSLTNYLELISQNINSIYME